LAFSQRKNATPGDVLAAPARLRTNSQVVSQDGSTGPVAAESVDFDAAAPSSARIRS